MNNWNIVALNLNFLNGQFWVGAGNVDSGAEFMLHLERGPVALGLYLFNDTMWELV